MPLTAGEMLRRPVAVPILLALSALVMVAFPASGLGAVQIGSNLDNPAGYQYSSGTTATITQAWIESGHAASGGLASPFDAVILKFTLRTVHSSSVIGSSSPPTPVRLRTFNPVNANVFTPVNTEANSHPPTDTTGLQYFATRLPIAAGDHVGVNLEAPSNNILNALGNSGLSGLAFKSPAPADGAAGTVIATASNELLLRADVEPDADHDAYGDETEDQCPADSARQTPPCAVSAAAADTTAPSVTLSSSNRQSAGKGITIEVQSNEPGSATANATVNVPGASKTLRFKPATASLVAGVKVKLKLKLSKKNVKAVRRAIKKGRKPKAKVAVSVKDATGNASNANSAIKLKR